MRSEKLSIKITFCALSSVEYSTASGVARNQQNGVHGAREGRLFPTRGAPLSASERASIQKKQSRRAYAWLTVLKYEDEIRFAGI